MGLGIDYLDIRCMQNEDEVRSVPCSIAYSVPDFADRSMQCILLFQISVPSDVYVTVYDTVSVSGNKMMLRAL